MIIVIPSNRAINLAYFEPLLATGARFIIVDDTEGSIVVNHPQFSVYSWKDRPRLLGKHEQAIPRRNGACRDLGFFIAWKESGDDEIVVALDDDCEVYAPDFASEVARSVSAIPRPVAQVEGAHLNILDLYAGAPANLFPRGFPYSARPGYQKCTFTPGASLTAKFSLGLWKGIFDVNAVDKISGPAYNHPNIELEHPSVIIPAGKFVSVCSMNMQFRREVIPAAYQLPMHVEAMPHWVIDRYGDIWGGFILKLLMDLRGDALAAGGPMIYHHKEGNFQRNIWQENICHLVNDEFIRILEEARREIAPAAYVDMLAALAEIFAKKTETSSPLLRPYLRHLAPALRSWVALLR